MNINKVYEIITEIKSLPYDLRAGEDEEKTLYVRHQDITELDELLTHGSTGKIEMEDGASSILVNSDTTDFFLAGQKSLKIDTLALKIALKNFLKDNSNIE